MWEAIQHIGTPISLAAFVAAVIAYVVLGNQKNKIQLLKSLPEDKRWELLNKDLESYNITQDNLTRDQKFELMKTVLMQKAEHRRRIIYVAFVIFVVISVLTGASTALTYYISNKSVDTPMLRVNSIFGEDEYGKPRVRVVPQSDNHLLLNQSFSNAKSKIRIVTELGNTWLLSENYQSFNDAINRRLDISVLMFDFTNIELRNMARYSSQKGEGKQGYTSDEVLRGLEDYRRLLQQGAKIDFGSYNTYPWIRFTIFDDTAVSFVLRPMLNMSRPFPLYSTDPVVIKMFEGIYNEFQKSSTMYLSESEFSDYIFRYTSTSMQ